MVNVLLRSAGRFKQKPLFSPPTYFLNCFPFPKDCLQHLQNHHSLCEWQPDLSRGSLQRDRVALWGAVQPCEVLPYPAPQGFPCSGYCQGTERGNFITVLKRSLEKWKENKILSFFQQNCLSWVEHNSVALLRSFSGQVSPWDTQAACFTVLTPGYQQLW